MQACVQCGLSIGEAASFCPVCGTRVGDGVAVATAVETGAPPAPAVDSEAGAGYEPQALEPQAPAFDATGLEPLEPLTNEPDRDEPGPEPAPGLVSEFQPAGDHASGADPEAARLDAVPVTGRSAILDAEPDPDRAELVADLASEHADDAAAEAQGAAQAEESPEDVDERRMAEIAALLEFAGRCEDVNAARAAAVYGEVIVGCLELTDDPLAAEPVRRDLLRGFDRLSFVLERQGLPDEALAVVDDAASLGLLDGADGLAAPQRDALRDRREDLRRILYGDSAQI